MWQKELFWDLTTIKKEEMRILRECHEKNKSRFEKGLSVFVMEWTMERLQPCERRFRENERKRLNEKGRRLGSTEEET